MTQELLEVDILFANTSLTNWLNLLMYSLVICPRPEVRHYVDFYTPEQMGVLSVRPGITDVASIKYSNENEILEKVEDPEEYYINVIMQDKLRINLEYVATHSFINDIKLIFMTFGAIFAK